MPQRAGSQLATSCAGPDDRRFVVGKYAGHRREVADVAINDSKQRDDGGLIGGDAIEVAQNDAPSV
jgi:hypothetical protein